MYGFLGTMPHQNGPQTLGLSWPSAHDQLLLTQAVAHKNCSESIHAAAAAAAHWQVALMHGGC